MIGIYREILEIRTCITELLARCPSEVTIRDPGAGNSTVDLQAILDDGPQTVVPDVLDEPNAIMLLPTPPDFSMLQPLALQSQFPGQEYGPLGSVGNTGLITEGADPPVGQIPQDLLPGMYSEGQTSSDSSDSVHTSQGKVKCTWPGCSRFLKKDNHTRHMNETHLRKVKAVCASCGKGFPRSYMKKEHICKAERRRA
ncbi:uncharacterized protein EDB91DRAFT_1253317 [Suillus paluster]|uniref:uncharacterized protein n=1 Tax=Suillus paluster TaxID=48578 RepID=UPI001B87E546|nr:uncharacterized protein EDB91DRAFT_1253317 [Suillus paluster]KAG1728720.1 hypothetical protein EDB91DRAFT_1253317 [Suillus paluster]